MRLLHYCVRYSHRYTPPSVLAAIALLLSSSLGLSLVNAKNAIALPPPDDTPEEILRTEIILEARSPVDGELLTASEYAELQVQLAESVNPPSIDSETQQLIYLLKIRRLLNMVLPFSVF